MRSYLIVLFIQIFINVNKSCQTQLYGKQGKTIDMFVKLSFECLHRQNKWNSTNGSNLFF